MQIYLAPVEHRPGTATIDLIRGFTDAELDDARTIVPEKPEPPVGTSVPREVRNERYLNRLCPGALNSNSPFPDEPR